MMKRSPLVNFKEMELSTGKICKEYIKQNIIMEGLRSANSQSVFILRLIKTINNVKED